LRSPRIAGGEQVHGTGCALSSAIAARLAFGYELFEACLYAKEYVTARIENPARPGRGAAVVV
jgi:hydroxymethylpyrimidine/phosphomethylpyrimidine kinase